MIMEKNFEAMQKMGQENMDLALKSFSAYSKGMQDLAVKAADFTKKSFEDNTQLVEKLMAAKTLDKAVEVQSEFAKTSYEGFVAEMTEMGEIVSGLSKEAMKPVEAMFAKK
jgi:phasin family protein